MMSARFERHIKGRAREVFNSPESMDFRVGPSELFMSSACDNPAIFDDNGSDHGIGMRFSQAPRGQSERFLHEKNILGSYSLLHSFLAILSRIPFTNLEESGSP